MKDGYFIFKSRDMVEESTRWEYLGEDHQGGQGPERTVEPEEEEDGLACVKK